MIIEAIIGKKEAIQEMREEKKEEVLAEIQEEILGLAEEILAVEATGRVITAADINS
jgi:hypothetical protein